MRRPCCSKATVSPPRATSTCAVFTPAGGSKYCVISFYIDARVFRMAPDRFRNEVVLPVLYSLPEVEIADGRQTMHISRADVEVAADLEVPVGEPMADVRRVLAAPDGTVLYLAEVSYRGDYIHLDMVLKP